MIKMVGPDGSPLEGGLHEKHEFIDKDLPTQFQFNAKDFKLNDEGRFEIKDAKGRIYDAQASHVLNNKSRFVVMRDRSV